MLMSRPNDYQEESWEGQDRRAPSTMSQQIEQALKQAMERHDVQVKAHLDNRFDELKNIMLSAFPDGDPVGHRQYHQTQIDYMNERRLLWKDIRSKSIIGGLWLLLGFLGMAVIEYLKREITK